MICAVCGNEDFYIEEDEFGDKIAYCMVCGEDFIYTDDDDYDEEWRLGPTTPFFFLKNLRPLLFSKVGRKWAESGLFGLDRPF